MLVSCTSTASVASSGPPRCYAVDKIHSSDKTYTRTTAPPRFTTDAVDKIHELVHSNDGTYMLLTIGAVDSNEGITYNIYMVSMVDALTTSTATTGRTRGLRGLVHGPRKRFRQPLSGEVEGGLPQPGATLEEERIHAIYNLRRRKMACAR